MKIEIERTRNGIVIRQIDPDPCLEETKQIVVYELEDVDGHVQVGRLIDFLGAVLLRLDISEIPINITKADK